MFGYAIKEYWLQILLALVIFGGLLWVSFQKPEWYEAINWFEAIAGVGTLILAAFLWWNSIRQAWENSLPKRLTAYYEFGGRNVIVFRNILLFNESDARAWAQQIARQKAGGDIQFEPFFRFNDKGVGESKNGKSVKNYEITFFLSAIPEKLRSRLGYANADESSKKWCVEWLQLEDEDGSISMDEILVVGNPKM